MLSPSIWHNFNFHSWISRQNILQIVKTTSEGLEKKNHRCNSRITGVIKPQINQWGKTEETALPQKLFEPMRGIFEHSSVFKVLIQCTNRKCYFSINVILDVEGGAEVAVRVCYNDRELRRWHVLFLRATAHDWPWTACDGKWASLSEDTRWALV